MKKKQLYLIAGIVAAVALAVVLTVCLVNYFAGQTEPPLLHGTWKVFIEVSEDRIKRPKNGFFVFNAEKATEYRDGESSAFVVSDYTYTEPETGNPVLEMFAFSEVYEVEIITENYIRLYTSETSYKALIRYGDEERKALTVSTDTIQGAWNVFYREGDKLDRELKLVFTSTGLIHNLEEENGSILDSISWDTDSNLCITAMNLKFACYPLSEEVLILVELNTDSVWELHKTPPITE